MNTPTSLNRPLVLLGLAAVLTLGACASGAASSSSPPPSQSPAPSAPGASPGGDGSSPDQGTGIVVPSDPGPGNPGAGEPTLVVPQPGQLNPRDVPASSLEASVDGRKVLVKVRWTSGVEPCYVLDSVKVVRVETDIAITLVEGSSDPNAICIEIAMEKATIVDLGELEPGSYTLHSPGGDATPITVVVS